MKISPVFLLLMGVMLLTGPAAAVTLDFETLPDLEVVTTQFAGLTFANTTALALGGLLNEFEFPPLSGTVVVSDDGGPITITFDHLVAAVSGFFTYTVPLTLTAFDALLLPVATDTSAFGSNLLLSGDPGSAPNELLGVAFSTGIKALTAQGDPAGFSFTLDDLSFTFADLSFAVPAPGTLLLVSVGVVVAAGWHRQFRSKRGRLPTIH